MTFSDDDHRRFKERDEIISGLLARIQENRTRALNLWRCQWPLCVAAVAVRVLGGPGLLYDALNVLVWVLMVPNTLRFLHHRRLNKRIDRLLAKQDAAIHQLRAAVDEEWATRLAEAPPAGPPN